tara:strand:+ start:1679 stop:2116 length:438 start_codon:yes stop_codon:yes gene_type:complete
VIKQLWQRKLKGSDMPAVSKSQQKFFGIVRAIQKGEMAPTTPETAEVAASMKEKDVKDFASTKHKGLPEKKKVEEGIGLSLARAIDKTKPPLGRPSLRRSISQSLKIREVDKTTKKNRTFKHADSPGKKSFKDFTKDVEAAKNKK